MRIAVALIPLLALAAAAFPVQAQPAADPIGALLDRHAQLSPAADAEEEPDAAGRPSASPEPEPAAAPPLPTAPVPYTPQVARPRLTGPVNIMETGKSPDAPPGLRDLAYESRVRSSFASAQGFQGPLDGGWTLAAQGEGDLYSLQLVDRGGGVMEGAWRDLRRKGAIGSSGFVDEIQRSSAGLTVRFSPAAGAYATVTLQGGYDGRWSGEMVEAGQRRAVTLRRTR